MYVLLLLRYYNALLGLLSYKIYGGHSQQEETSKKSTQKVPSCRGLVVYHIGWYSGLVLSLCCCCVQSCGNIIWCREREGSSFPGWHLNRGAHLKGGFFVVYCIYTVCICMCMYYFYCICFYMYMYRVSINTYYVSICIYMYLYVSICTQRVSIMCMYLQYVYVSICELTQACYPGIGHLF